MSQSPSTGSIPSTASQARLAELLDISPAQASRLLSGERLPSVELMARVKMVFGWSGDAQIKRYVEGTYAAGLRGVWDQYQAAGGPTTRP